MAPARAIGETVISPSSNSQPKNTWSPLKRVCAVAGFQRRSWSVRNSSMCSREIDSTLVGIPRSMTKAPNSRTDSRYDLTVLGLLFSASNDRSKDFARAVSAVELDATTLGMSHLR